MFELVLAIYYIFLNVSYSWYDSQLSGTKSQQRNKGELNHLLLQLMRSILQILRRRKIIWLAVMRKMNGTDFFVLGKGQNYCPLFITLHLVGHMLYSHLYFKICNGLLSITQKDDDGHRK